MRSVPIIEFARNLRGRIGDKLYLVAAMTLLLTLLPLPWGIGSHNADALTGKLASTSTVQANAPEKPAVGNQQVDFPLFLQSAEMSSVLLLNNTTTDAIAVALKIFNGKGESVEVAPLTLRPQMPGRFEMKELLTNARGDFSAGNIQASYAGPMLGVTGQVTISSERHRLSFESTMAMPAMFASSRLDGIAWVPDESTLASVALTNVADGAINVTLTGGQGAGRPVTLKPRETRLIGLQEFLTRRGGGSAAAPVSIEHAGAIGALIATGFAYSRRTGFSCNLHFVDRATATSNQLAGAHFRFGRANASEGFPADSVFRAPLVLANFGDAPAEAHVAVDYSGGGQPGRVDLNSITLEPRQWKEVNLTEEMAKRGVTGPVENAGVDIRYSGPVGSVIGRLTSLDAGGDLAFDVPVKDPLAGVNRVGGTYPWRLDGEYTTVLHLKNTTDKSVHALVQIRFEGGSYNPERLDLAPYQTVAVDIKQLRDSQQADVRGRPMPMEATQGQVKWYEEEVGSLIGRAEARNVSAGRASSFSCADPCTCPPGTSSVYMDPSSATSGVGDQGYLFAPKEMRADCYVTYGPYDRSGDCTWDSIYPNVASVASDGYVVCVSEGQTAIRATFQARYYGGPLACDLHFYYVTPAGNCQVVPCSVTIQEDTISPVTAANPNNLPVYNPARIRRMFAPLFQATLPRGCPVTWSITGGPGSIVGSTTDRIVTVNGNAVGFIYLRATTSGGAAPYEITVPVVDQTIADVRAIIVRRSDGSQAPVTTTQVQKDIAKANLLWVQCGVQFNLVSTTFIDNTTYWRPNHADRASLRDLNQNTGAIELYYVDSFPDDIALGLTNDKGVVVRKAANYRSVSHEIGHAMGAGHDGIRDLHLMHEFTTDIGSDIPISICRLLIRFTSN